ncbi:MAG: hypothetical protein ACR2NN_29840 [Bryobacteraceae bacterium]
MRFQRAAEGVLYDVFRQREVGDSKDTRQRGDPAPGFAPEQVLLDFDHMFIFITGRASPSPPASKIGHPF